MKTKKLATSFMALLLAVLMLPVSALATFGGELPPEPDDLIFTDDSTNDDGTLIEDDDTLIGDDDALIEDDDALAEDDDTLIEDNDVLIEDENTALILDEEIGQDGEFEECALEEHIHDEDCYVRDVICDHDSDEDHDPDCFDNYFDCGYEEHIHDALACYGFEMEDWGTFSLRSSGVDYEINSTTSTDNYYNLIKKTDWEIAPGIHESQIILDNDEGSYRQVLFVMEADLNNEYVKVINSYNGMVPTYGDYKTGVMSEQAAKAEDMGYGNVVGAMNTCLSWYSGYPADRVGEPLGFIMLDAETLFDPSNCGYDYGKVGFPSVLVINKDFDEEGNPRPADIPKVEMPQITSADDLDGWEDQVIPVSSGYIVKEGVNQAKPNHTDAAPRSVVGIKPDGTVVIMLNDGRQAPYSSGMSMYELAEVMLDLGCSYAVNCDGGGSSTYLSQRPGEDLKVNNSPSDGAERPTTSGILFISTAPADGEFARATITAEHDYYAPNSTVEFTALGTDLVGTATEIPEDVEWQLADSTMGTIENGIFKSNGTVGTVTAQMVYNREVVGEASVEIVMPETFSFAQKNIVVPLNSTVNIALIATINGGLNDVAIGADLVELVLDNGALGTIDGLTFTSIASDEGLESIEGKLTAVLAGTDMSAEAKIKLGESSKVLFDFEDASDVDVWNIADVNGNDAGFEQILSHATAQNGQVHDGQGSLRVEMNPIAAPGISNGGYAQSDLFLDEGIVVEGALNIGFWAYIPDEYEHCWIRVLYWYDPDGDGKFDKKNTITVINQPEVYNTWDESGWKYFSIDVSAYDKILIPGLDCKDRIAYNASKNDANNFRFIEFMFPHTNTNTLWKTYGTINGLQTVYIDNITADYSEAVDDRDAPVFSDIALIGDNDTTTALEKYNTVKTNSNMLSVTVKAEEVAKDNASGLNPSSAKAYVDGVEVKVNYSNGRVFINNIAVADGVHRVKFEIADRTGNKAVIVRLIEVDSGEDVSTVQLVPADSTLDSLYGGSVYWMDLNATDIETVEKVKAAIDLNYGNHWELDHMVLAEGFTAEYEIDEENNKAFITITRTDENTQTGEVTLASLPIRIIYFDTDIKVEGYDAQTFWTTYGFWPYDLKVDVDMGEITYVEDYASDVLGAFSNAEFSVDTELQTAFSDPAFKAARGTAHVHIEETLEDQEATCAEAGYVDRTFCNVCNSVVDWGEIVEGGGHSYDFVDGVLKCGDCGKLFNGVHTDGKTYVDGVVTGDGWVDDTYYFVDGVMVTGQYPIDGTMYTFDENGVYQPNASYTGFYHDGTGWMYFMGNFQKKGFVVIDGNTHYFDDRTGYAPIGSFTLAEDRVYKVEGEQGKVLGAWDTVIDNGVEYRRYYYSLRYYKNEWVEIEGEKYFFNNEGYALTGTHAVAAKGAYLGGYRFAEDGRMIEAITGPFIDKESGWMFFAENGELACNELVKYGDNYYFARNNYLLITWSTYISEEQTNGLLPAGEYQFGPDGKLIMQNGPVADPYNPEYLNFYKDGLRVYEEGLYEFEGDYYYVRPNGLLLTWGMNITKTNGLLPAGEYKFGADGKLQMLNGPMEDAYNSAYLNFYKDGVRVYEEGLYEFEGEYYYVRSNGLLLTWGMNITKTNGLLPAGEYKFGTDGKLQMLNGPQADAYNDAYLNFYKDGVRVYEEGLYEYEGDYYYVRSNGLLLTWGMEITKTNGLMPAGEYKFGEDGKLQMLNGPIEDAYNDAYLNFYKDGIRIYEEGLYEYEGDYYYVRSNGLLITWGTYVSEEKANDLLPAGEYKFGEDGKLIMLNGPVADELNPAYINFYKDGIRVYEEGLYEFEGDYYYVRPNGLLLTWGTYVSEEMANGLLPAGDYQFGADGKMIQ